MLVKHSGGQAGCSLSLRCQALTGLELLRRDPAQQRFSSKAVETAGNFEYLDQVRGVSEWRAPNGADCYRLERHLGDRGIGIEEDNRICPGNFGRELGRDLDDLQYT